MLLLGCTENWFSSLNDDVEGRKYYVRSSFDQTHNKANIYQCILLFYIILYDEPDETTVEKNIELLCPTSQKYRSPSRFFCLLSCLTLSIYILVQRLYYIFIVLGTLHNIYIGINIYKRVYILETRKIEECKSNVRKFQFVSRTMWRLVCEPCGYIIILYFISICIIRMRSSGAS